MKCIGVRLIADLVSSKSVVHGPETHFSLRDHFLIVDGLGVQNGWVMFDVDGLIWKGSSFS